jgi:hypothetical protein
MTARGAAVFRMKNRIKQGQNMKGFDLKRGLRDLGAEVGHSHIREVCGDSRSFYEEISATLDPIRTDHPALSAPTSPTDQIDAGNVDIHEHGLPRYFRQIPENFTENLRGS